MKLNHLFEMFVIGDKKGNKPSNGDNIIAYKQWIWVISGSDIEDVILDDIIDKTDLIGVHKEDINDVWDLISTHFNERRPDVLAGSIRDGYFVIEGGSNFRHSTASDLLRKTIKQLGLRGVTITYYSSDEEDTAQLSEDRDDFLTPLAKKTFYHGTSYNYLEAIASQGLRATNFTNFKNIHHEDKTFITLNKEKAEFHATNAAEKNKSFPIVLELKIPDSSQLVLDYDVAISFYGKEHPNTIELNYDEIHDFVVNEFKGWVTSYHLSDIVNKLRNDTKGQLNTKLGVFGYSGRIPASFVEYVLMDRDALHDFLFNEEFGDGLEIKFSPVNDWSAFNKKQALDERQSILDDISSQYAVEEEEEEQQDEN